MNGVKKAGLEDKRGSILKRGGRGGKREKAPSKPPRIRIRHPAVPSSSSPPPRDTTQSRQQRKSRSLTNHRRTTLQSASDRNQPPLKQRASNHPFVHPKGHHNTCRVFYPVCFVLRLLWFDHEFCFYSICVLRFIEFMLF